jgi:hypothetical protein
MAWFRNRYQCDRCQFAWHDEWSCMCDDDCPACGARHMSPYDTDDLTEIIAKHGDEFAVFRSSDTAERKPDYQAVGVFPTLELAGAMLAEC